MADQPDPSLNDRLDRLETTVRELQARVDQLSRQRDPPADVEAKVPAQHPVEQPAASPSAKTTSSSRPPPAASKRTTTKKPWTWDWDNENWLNLIGVGLLLFGLAFLFKYSIDQGWITPAVRVAFGGVLGVGLLAVGLRLRPHRHRLSQVLLGGSVATFYVTIFAAYQLYSLVAYEVGFVVMVATTLLAFVLSMRRSDAALAVIGAIGGLGTPFLLYTDEGSFPGLVGYTCLILAGSGAIYLYRGWRSLIFTAFIGGWLVLTIGFLNFVLDTEPATVDQVSFQLGVLCGWLLLGVLPAVRHVLRQQVPDQWPSPPLKVFKGINVIEHPALPLAVLSPLLALALARGTWDLSAPLWGWIFVVGSLLYGGAYEMLHRRAFDRLSTAHGLAAAALLALALTDLLDAPAVVLALAVEAAALIATARWRSNKTLAFVGHTLFFIIALVLVSRLTDIDADLPALVNAQALTELGTLVVGIGSLRLLRTRRTRLTYGLALHGLVLLWCWRELVDLPNGQAYVSIAWGLYAVVLLILGLRSDTYALRATALATILLIVGKLFLVDLSKLGAVWRILLFLGFGSALLLLSYALPNLWKPPPENNPPPS